jgi:hypothetical protein
LAENLCLGVRLPLRAASFLLIRIDVTSSSEHVDSRTG